jgi:cbb3-type cytochrome oxidase maturation protein
LNYLWAAKTGQFDDKITPAMRILFEENNVYTENDCSSNKKSKQQ